MLEGTNTNWDANKNSTIAKPFNYQVPVVLVLECMMNTDDVN